MSLNNNANQPANIAPMTQFPVLCAEWGYTAIVASVGGGSGSISGWGCVTEIRLVISRRCPGAFPQATT